MLRLCFLPLVIGLSHAQINTTVCGLPANPRFQSQQEQVPFCVVIRGTFHTANGSVNVEGDQYFTWFYPEVDTFTLFEIHTSSAIYRNDSWVRIEVGQDYISEERQYTSNGLVVTGMHGYFAVTGGRFVEWVWDDQARELCDDETPALGNFCADTRQNCNNPGNNLDCDLQLYAGWFGTDVNDVFLQSRESLLSNYRQFSTADLYLAASESARDSVLGAIDQIPRLGNIQNPFPFP